MCIVKTSYPCPEPDDDELFRRLKNTRRVIPCDIVHSTDGRPSSCAGELNVQHCHLGQCDFCSRCSMIARLEYAKSGGEQTKKRKVGSATADEAVNQGYGENAVKKAKAAEENDVSASERSGSADSVQGETLSMEDQTRSFGVTWEIFSSQDVGLESTAPRPPTVGPKATTKLVTENNGKIRVDGCVAEASGKPHEPLTSEDLTRQVNEAVAVLRSPLVDSPNSATDGGIKDVKAARPAQENSHLVSKLVDNTKTAKAKDHRMVMLTTSNSAKAVGSKSPLMTECEKVRSTFEMIYHGLPNAIRDYTDILKQNAILLQQTSKDQLEINGLKTTISLQNEAHLAECKKYKDTDKYIDSQKANMVLEKQELEMKIGKVMQKIDKLIEAALMANEEKNSVKAKFRGQENRVAELEGQIAIMKHIEDCRKTQLEEVRNQNEVLQKQNIVLKGKSSGGRRS